MSISPPQNSIGVRPIPMPVQPRLYPANAYNASFPPPHLPPAQPLPILLPLRPSALGNGSSSQPALPGIIPPISNQPVTKNFLPTSYYPVGIWVGGIAASALAIAGIIFGYKKYQNNKNNSSVSSTNSGKTDNVTSEKNTSSAGIKTKKTIQYDAKTAHDIPTDKNFARLNKEIKHKDFSGEDLRNANFKGLKLTQCNFDNAKLDGANFEGADVSGCSFHDSSKGFALSPKGLNVKNALFYESWPVMADANTQGVRKIYASREDCPVNTLNTTRNSSSKNEKKADLLPSVDLDDQQVFNATAEASPQQLNAAIRSFKNTIAKRIEGQDLAIEELGDLLTMVYIKGGKKIDEKEKKGAPRIVVCLAGPSGVGKTETIQQLARKFNREVITLNGGDYSSEIHTTKIVGSSLGYHGNSDRTIATDIIDACERAKKEKKSPPIILIDEIDKAHPEFFRIWNNIMEQGSLESRYNADKESKMPAKKVDFRGVDIFVTSNFGQHQIREFLKGKTTLTQDDKDKMTEIIKQVSDIEKGVQSDFWGRFSRVIPYSNLSPDTVEKLTRNKIQKEVEDLYLRHGFHLEVDETVIKKVAKAGFSLTEGCRAIDNAVDKHINAPIGTAIQDLTDCGHHKKDYGGSSGDIIRLTLTKQGDIASTIAHADGNKKNRTENKPNGILRPIISPKKEATLSDIYESMSSSEDKARFSLLQKRYNKVFREANQIYHSLPVAKKLADKIDQKAESEIGPLLKTLTSNEKDKAQRFIKAYQEIRAFYDSIQNKHGAESAIAKRLKDGYLNNTLG